MGRGLRGEVGGKGLGGKCDNASSHVVCDSVFMTEMDRRRHVGGKYYPRHLFGGSFCPAFRFVQGPLCGDRVVTPNRLTIIRTRFGLRAAIL